MASSLVARQSLSALSFSTAVKGAALSVNRVAAAPAVAPHGLGVSALLGFNKTAVPAKSTPVKKQLRTEDGIFGTSGGFGFTKANELFVGRVAMLGFAASLLGEAVTGQGILSQLNLETGIPITEAEPLLLFFIAFTVLGAIGGLGDRGKFVDDEAPASPPVKPGSFKAALGLSDDGPLFGFTKANELFMGRMAQLGFAASLIGCGVHRTLKGWAQFPSVPPQPPLPNPLPSLAPPPPLLTHSVPQVVVHTRRVQYRRLRCTHNSKKVGSPSSAPPFCRQPSVSRCLLTHDSTPPPSSSSSFPLSLPHLMGERKGGEGGVQNRGKGWSAV
ncbi:unnamed protein product [Closterium sp. Naga37s-1]|nr:unnamed protein product [Closterium sp. Naga37s-1]